MAVRCKPTISIKPIRGPLSFDDAITGGAFYESIWIDKSDEIPQRAAAIAVEIRHGSATVFFVDESGTRHEFGFSGKRLSWKEFQAKYGLRDIKRKKGQEG